MRFSSKLTAVAVMAVAGAIGSQARASILSFSDLSVSGLNAGTVNPLVSSLTTASSYDTSYINYQETVRSYSVVTLQPTNTSQGVALDWTETTTTYINRRTDYKYDYSYLSVSTEESETGLGKYLLFTGKIKSSEDTGFHFGLFADGKYTSANIPGVGAIPNGSVAFLTGQDVASLAADRTSVSYDPLSSRFSADSGYYGYSNYSGYLPLKAGETVSFAAMVYSSNASLSTFEIRGYSDNYDIRYKDTPVSYSSDKYVGSRVLAAVPEPETYAMLLAGLGLMGAIARRRKAVAAA